MILKAIAVAAGVGEIQAGAPGEIRLLPAGVFRARDGRPKGAAGWRVDGAVAARLLAQAKGARGDYVIDYEHQTLHAEDNGQAAPAAGWFRDLEWREGDGLYAVDVRWTARARAHIEAGEYRYISPVFQYHVETGEVLALQMAALTNYPAIDGNSDLAVRAAAKFNTKEENNVDRDKLIALLGLAADASDEQIESGLAALKAKAGEAQAKDTEIAALKAAADKGADPAKFVPVATFEALKTEVAALRAERTGSEVAALVTAGLEAGKLLPVQKEWAESLGRKDIAALKSYLEKTPPIAGLDGTQTGGRAPDEGGEDGLSAAELAVCRNLGLDPEDYKKVPKA